MWGYLFIQVTVGILDPLLSITAWTLLFATKSFSRRYIFKVTHMNNTQTCLRISSPGTGCPARTSVSNLLKNYNWKSCPYSLILTSKINLQEVDSKEILHNFLLLNARPFTTLLEGSIYKQPVLNRIECTSIPFTEGWICTFLKLHSVILFRVWKSMICKVSQIWIQNFT